ncbi:hypothetical protein METY_1474 [Methylopila sp. Yamaguchi]|nr:hypothetical protein METY_1474 [Methylopila sp. Yamaguchi]
MNSATICGWEKRTIVKAKKPTSARTTASIAAMRPAPKERKNPTNPFTAVSRRRRWSVARHPARFACRMVNGSLTGARGGKRKRKRRREAPAFATF